MEILEISDVCNIPLSLTYERGGKKEKWGDYETKLLLSLWNEFSFELKIAKRNAKIFMKIAAELRALNPRKPARTAREVKIKITNLSKMWRRERSKEMNDGYASSWVFFDPVGKILGYLPCESDTLLVDCLNSEDKVIDESDVYDEDKEGDALQSANVDYQLLDTYPNIKYDNGNEHINKKMKIEEYPSDDEEDTLDVFGKFVVAELRNIQDPQLLQNTKFSIQKLLHEAQTLTHN